MDNGLISVDRWVEGSQVYFLTHLHADHTQGLSSSWSRGLLFCSRLTAKLFPFRFPGFDLSLIRVLTVGTWHSLSLMSPTNGSKTTVQVMPVDADHCPGAVMLLFRGEFGCLLYTGDFRWEAQSERAVKGRKMLISALKDDVVDILYLDNTYCNPSYDFPSRQVAAQQVVDIIVCHPDHDIIIGIDSLGKEELLLHISRVLQIKIWVWPERLQTMHLLGLHEVFTTNTTLTRVRAVPRYSFSVETLEALNLVKPTIGIMPSGLPWIVRPLSSSDNLSASLYIYRSKLCENHKIRVGKPQGNVESVKRLHDYMYSVPYSDHSCCGEIEDFIKLVQPTNLKGIVSSTSCYIEPMYYFGGLCRIHHLSEPLHPKSESETRNGKFGTFPVKSLYSCGDSAKTKRKRGRPISLRYSRYRGSWVNALRQIRQGAKLLEYDILDQ